MSVALAEPQTSPAARLRAPRRPATRAALLHCLIVAPHEERRQFLERAAQLAGWQTTACANAAEATEAATRFRHQLALIDLDGAGSQAAELCSLTEHLAGGNGPLLMICAQEGNTLEEIWARQLGVWLYLPGVDSTSDVPLLCREAQDVVTKLQLESGSRQSGRAFARTA